MPFPGQTKNKVPEKSDTSQNANKGTYLPFYVLDNNLPVLIIQNTARKALRLPLAASRALCGLRPHISAPFRDMAAW